MEILIAILILLAIFLLVERMHIRQSLYKGLMSLLAGLKDLGVNLFQGMGRFVSRTTLSDLVAYGLLLLVAGLVAWRARQRLMTHPSLTEIECPHCGSDLHRIRRRQRERLLNLLVPVRRYQCKNRDCRWRGVRIGRSRHQ